MVRYDKMLCWKEQLLSEKLKRRNLNITKGSFTSLQNSKRRKIHFEKAFLSCLSFYISQNLVIKLFLRLIQI